MKTGRIAEPSSMDPMPAHDLFKTFSPRVAEWGIFGQLVTSGIISLPILNQMWGGRPRPRRTPWSGFLLCPTRPTRGSAAGQGAPHKAHPDTIGIVEEPHHPSPVASPPSPGRGTISYGRVCEERFSLLQW